MPTAATPNFANSSSAASPEPPNPTTQTAARTVPSSGNGGGTFPSSQIGKFTPASSTDKFAPASQFVFHCQRVLAIDARRLARLAVSVLA